ncbi:hypothetical protein HMSLTHF_00580 [Vreelandella aquamarina]|uniref:Uncharacterized protein n=1 Tax=Vreelandella aquamarina TaxID=77097 RepID=A0A6F8SQR8_9GAMM|nr:hypothetical protein HMSLTHF_00580 [Halomonas meridiana]
MAASLGAPFEKCAKNRTPPYLERAKSQTLNGFYFSTKVEEKILNALISILNRICGTSIALYKLLNDKALAVSHTRQTIIPITA